MPAPHRIQAEYDLVFAGGGTAACVTAGRLARAFPYLSILVLESGPTTQDKKEHIQPGQFITHLTPTSKTLQFYASKPSDHLGGRSIVVSTGRCIGGGASVNLMLYNRPAASDFDDWEKDFGNEGWAAKDLIPMLEKAETYELDPWKPTHGSSGPLKVSFGGSPLGRLGKEFIQVGSEYEKDRPRTDEGNAFNVDSLNKFFAMPKWISSNGRRSDVAHHYVYHKCLGNLSVFDGCLVNRVVIANGVAVGVEYLWDNRVHESAPQDIQLVKARKLVVVSAGAMGSPLILERSGIGRKDVLEKADIPVIAELPGVGENYQDHAFLCTPYIADPAAETINGVIRGDPATWGNGLEQWEKDGSGVMGNNGIDAAVKIRPSSDELRELGPEFAGFWNKALANKPDKPLLLIGVLAGLPADQSALPPLNYMCSGTILGYSESRGYIHTLSSDPYAAPDFESGFLSSPADIVALRWAYKKSRELFRRLPSYRGTFYPAHPPYAADSPAAIEETGPVALDAPNIVYSAEDDAAIEAYIRQVIATTWHSLGTCAMKPLEQGGVVDSNLNVYGVKKLKVVDLSIPPSNVNSNTYSAVVAIGEKAAVIIAKELSGTFNLARPTQHVNISCCPVM
ncbi:GMC oxidoreductase-domain-containing protein [Mycena polygramma]|nr:GMC oxidoreductase-domain-containing protein [Mycena polygramma]